MPNRRGLTCTRINARINASYGILRAIRTLALAREAYKCYGCGTKTSAVHFFYDKLCLECGGHLNPDPNPKPNPNPKIQP